MLSGETWGTGPVPALLLHGFTGDRTAWRGVAEQLSVDWTATAVDLPGHGAAPPAVGYDATLSALEPLLAERPIVVGYSQGARLALGLAVQFPDRLRGLVLESGSPGIADETERDARREVDERLADRIERDGVERFVAEWEALPLWAGIRRLPGAVQQTIRSRRLVQSAPGLASALRAYGTAAQPSFWSALPDVGLPTLLVTGALDRKFTATAARMAAAMPDARHVALDGCGHAPHIERPEAYADLVRDFLRTLIPNP